MASVERKPITGRLGAYDGGVQGTAPGLVFQGRGPLKLTTFKNLKNLKE